MDIKVSVLFGALCAISAVDFFRTSAGSPKICIDVTYEPQDSMYHFVLLSKGHL